MALLVSARDVACDVLEAVRLKDAYANLELPGALRRARLDPSDAGFATELTYGTLRMQGLYDAVISQASGRSTTDIDPGVLDILRLGVHQWIALATPAHAVVDESAELTRRRASRGAIGFVNAVMRRVTEKTADEWVRAVTDGQKPDDSLAIETSHPSWIIRAFRSALAHEGRSSELRELLDANNEPPRVTLVRLHGESAIDNTHVGKYSPRALTLSGGDPASVDAVASGQARVQDEGSQLAALALTRARPIAADERWLDMCAGPGGKTALLAAESLDVGVSITANEVAPHRAQLVRSAVTGFKHVEVVEGDGRRFGAEEANSFDRVLVDAPCSGVGALRRRPESRWRRSPSDVATLTAIQSDLLMSALRAVKPGGLVAYVTCSPHLVETRSIVDRAIMAIPGVYELDAKAVLANIVREPMDLSGGDLSAQLWPHRHNTDAMFISLLTK